MLTLGRLSAYADAYGTSGIEHIALALTTIKQGLVPVILSEASASAAVLRAAILDRYRRAS